MASGELSETEFIGFLQGFLDNSRAVCADGAIQFACIDWRHIFELLSAGRAVDLDLLNLCVWVKPNGGMGSLYRSRHELVACFKSGTGKHTNNIELGRFGRNRTNVWEYAGMNSLSAERDAQLRLHPTVKPVAMVADALLDCSPRGSIVLDPFGGSGTLLIAAEKVRRRARLLEIDPGYCDVAVRRWQDWSGECAVHEASGRAFPEIAEEQAPAERAASNAAEHGNIPSKGGHR